MIRYTPRLPRPGAAQRSFRIPPDPGITGPASGTHQRLLKCSVLLISQAIEHELGKELRLDEAEHALDYTALPYSVNGNAKLPI
jgi:hypothetical protein